MNSSDNRRPSGTGNRNPRSSSSASSMRGPQGQRRPQGGAPVRNSQSGGQRRPVSASGRPAPAGGQPRRQPSDGVRRAPADGPRRNPNQRPASAPQRNSQRGSSVRQLDAGVGVSYDNRRSSGRTSAGGRGRNTRKKSSHALLYIEIAVIAMLIIALIAWMKFGRMNWDETVDTSDIVVNKEMAQETQEVLKGYETIALFGVDNRSNGNYDSGNSDSIMICNIDKDTKEVKVVSVYRDTYLNCGSDTYRKCNYAYNHGGPAQAINMLNTCLDLNITHYVSVDFFALAKVVDALGGVTIDISEEEAKYINDCYIDATSQVVGHQANRVSAGLQNLDGIQAVCYCRVRYTAGDDFKRAERQRYVLSLLVEKALQTDMSTINNIVDGVLPCIATNYTATEILAMAADMKSYQLVYTGGFPQDLTTGLYGNKGSLVVPCSLESNVRKLHSTLYNNNAYEPSSTVTKTSNQIKNDTGCNENSATKVNGQY